MPWWACTHGVEVLNMHTRCLTNCQEEMLSPGWQWFLFVTSMVLVRKQCNLFWQKVWSQTRSLSTCPQCLCKPSRVQGKRVHACIVKAGLEKDVFVGNVLVNMYSKSGSLQDAHQAFDNISYVWCSLMVYSDLMPSTGMGGWLFSCLNKCNMREWSHIYGCSLSLH
jgi:hypothetical protein